MIGGPGAAPGKPIPDADLDAIVLMALRKEPERRYASAAQMGEDIQRYLEDRPVIAHRTDGAIDSPGSCDAIG